MLFLESSGKNISPCRGEWWVVYAMIAGGAAAISQFWWLGAAIFSNFLIQRKSLTPWHYNQTISAFLLVIGQSAGKSHVRPQKKIISNQKMILNFLFHNEEMWHWDVRRRWAVCSSRWRRRELFNYQPELQLIIESLIGGRRTAQSGPPCDWPDV